MNMRYNWLFTVLILCSLACASTRIQQDDDPLATYNPGQQTLSPSAPQVRNFESIYLQMGLASSGPPISFVSNAAFFASASPDSTYAETSISIPNRGLSFIKEGEEYRAEYQVTIVVEQNDKEVTRITSTEPVRVPTFKETTRTDESLLYQHHFLLAPGRYTVSYTVRDMLGETVREGSARAFLIVPAIRGESVSRPVVVYEATPRTSLAEPPQYLAAPRAAAIFGVDSTVSVYVEGYGSQSTSVELALKAANGKFVAWQDTIQLAPCGSFTCGLVHIPLSHADIGVFHLVSKKSGATDSTTTPIFIGFGSDLPVVTFEEMVSYLRFFAAPSQLRALREATVDNRGAAWTEFVRRHEGSGIALQEYFLRIRDANVQFRGESVMPGWLSDRGSTFVAFGQPDNIYEQDPSNPRYYGRIRWQIWEYQRFQTRIAFYDEYNAGQWKFEPESAMQFRSLLARVIGTQ